MSRTSWIGIVPYWDWTTKMNDFEMSVTDTFNLADGTMIFSGIVNPSSEAISAGDCEIVFQDKVLATIHTDGELIIKGNTTTQRAISISNTIDLKELGLENGGFSTQ